MCIGGSPAGITHLCSASAITGAGPPGGRRLEGKRQASTIRLVACGEQALLMRLHEGVSSWWPPYKWSSVEAG